LQQCRSQAEVVAGLAHFRFASNTEYPQARSACPGVIAALFTPPVLNLSGL
jgi:hypothetical protein